MNKNGTILLFVGSVSLILVAIIFTTVIDKSRENKKTDVRARASKSGTMVFLGVVSSWNEDDNTVIVDNMKFADTQGKALGSFTVTVPSTISPSRFPSGTKIRITASPATFQVGTRTLTATEIEKQ